MLGPLEVDVGERVKIEAPKQRAVLETLAIFADADVATSTLIDAVWGDSPPPTAAASLQSHVSRLRRLLPTGTIVTDGHSYRLELDPDDVDLHRFERLVVAGGQALGGDDPAHALDLIDTALALWRGSPLEDLADGDVRAGHIARLDGLWWTARALRLEALLALGRPELVIFEAEEMTASRPLDERAWAQLMIALYRTGRRADAVAAYGRLRRTLRDELGVSPSAELRELESRVLAEDVTLEAQMRARRVVPNPRSTFVGRESLIDEVDRVLGDHRLVTLVGPGGVGKTRLAIEVARSVDMERWPHGVWWVDLNGWRGDGWLTRRLIGALGVVSPPGMQSDEALRRFVAHRAMLLVVDRAEVAVAEVAVTLARLLDAAPEFSVLVTSRLPLGLDGERLVRVDPLQVPAPDADDPAAVEAVRLFMTRREERGATRERDDPRVVAELCRSVGGLPLGIEMLAARVGVVDADELLLELRTNPRSVLAGDLISEDPHRNLSGVFESTLGLLDESARTLLARLAVCPGSFDLGLACALGESTARHDLARLVDAALVVDAQAGPGERRFRLPDPTRAFAGPTLEAGEREEVRRRHAKYFRDLMVRAGREMAGERDRAWIQRFAREEANLQLALTWWIERDPAGALVFAHALGRSTQPITDDVELCELFDRMLDAAPGEGQDGHDALGVARVRLRRGWPRFLTGDFDGGMDDMRSAAATFDAHGDLIGSAEAHSGLGHMVVLATADADAAAESYARAIISSRRAGAPLTTAMALAEQAQSLIFADRADAGIDAMLDEAEALFRDVDDAGGLAHVMMDRTLAAYAVDDLERADRYADESIRWSRERGDVTYEQIAHLAKAVGHLHAGEAEAAAAGLTTGVRLAVDAHNLLQLGVALHAVAVYAALFGQPHQAARLRGGASVLAPMWPLFERRYGELTSAALAELGDSLPDELAAGAELDLDELLALVDSVLTER